MTISLDERQPAIEWGVRHDAHLDGWQVDPCVDEAAARRFLAGAVFCGNRAELVARTAGVPDAAWILQGGGL